MKKEKNSLLYSLLLSMNDLNNHEVTAEDLKYMHDTLVNECQIKLYMQVVEWLSQGKSFDEIFILLDNIELEANYDANIYNLIFNSKDNNDSLIKRKIKFDSEYGILLEVEKDGYTFNGWKNSNGDFVSSDTLYNVPEDTNLYAEWNLITYDIKYNLNGGTLDEAPTNYNIESEDIIIPSPKKVGYSFIGWTTPDNKEPKIDYKISTGSIGDKELTANYEPITYYISYNSYY